MKTVRRDRKISRRKIHTHVPLTPFVDDIGLRFLVYCGCPHHQGFLKVREDHRKEYCHGFSCLYYKQINIDHEHEYSPEKLREKEILSENLSQNARRVVKINPLSDEQNSFYWAKDSGETIFILKSKSLELFQGEEDLSRDHFKLVVN